jgi:hypothetical protein
MKSIPLFVFNANEKAAVITGTRNKQIMGQPLAHCVSQRGTPISSSGEPLRMVGRLT